MYASLLQLRTALYGSDWSVNSIFGGLYATKKHICSVV